MFVLLPALRLGAAALSPEQELASFHLADAGLQVELVAAEPEVLSPVAIAWDADGRLYVAEMIDYPTGPTAGQIRRLEDRDGDGRYETATVFADGLPFPNGVLPWRDGLLVTAAPDILFLKDTDGDGRADERRVILTGFAEGNQQLRVNGLLWGLDGWVYGANGRSDGDLHRPGEKQKVSLRGHDFRFQPGTGAFETVAGRSQFGLARDDWGNRFLSWNTIPVRHEIIPERALARNPRLPTTLAVRDLLPPGDTGEVFPLTPAPQTFNQESTSHFNALAGLTLFRGDALPPRYQGNAFVGETLRNLVHRRALEPAGPSFVARRPERATEFLASTDPWFHPVNFATGPDGSLYVVDFYRAWVEHPGFVPAPLRGGVAWRTGAEHGRIWRVRARDMPPSRPRPALAQAPTEELVRQLEHGNGWWRDTAQRLLVERSDRTATPLLKRLASRAALPQARVLSLHTLQCLQTLDDPAVRAALADRHPRVREAALRLAEGRPALDMPIAALTRDADARVRLQAALSLPPTNDSVRVKALARLASRPDLDLVTVQAIRCSAAPRAWPVLEHSWRARSDKAANARLELVRALASDVSAATAPALQADRRALLAALTAPRSRPLEENHLALVAGFAAGLDSKEKRTGFHEWLAAPAQARFVDELLQVAQATATRPTTVPSLRDIAGSVLARAGTTKAREMLAGLLLPSQPDPVQSAAATAIAGSGDPALLREAFGQWGQCPIATRRRLLAGAVHSAPGIEVILEALRDRRLAATELDATARQNLRQNAPPSWKPQLETWLGGETPERGAVVKTFAAATTLAGEARRGAASFARLCLQCHALQGRGQPLGPDLSGIRTRHPEALLTDILDPSRQVAPDYVSYSIRTTAGDTVTGLLISETRDGLTLRRANAPDETIARASIQEVLASGRSLMPDGLETGLTVQDLADLLAFLRQPDPALLPAGD